MRTIDVAERRARLARRQLVAPAFRAATVEEATEAIVCLHGTDPASIYLATLARVDGFTVADLDRALYVDRTLVKHLAMRRTLFVFPRDMLEAAQAGASARVATQEQKRTAKLVEDYELQADGTKWLAAASRAVLAALDGGREATSMELRKEIPLLEGAIAYGEGKSWAGRMSIGPRVLTVLSAEGRVVRASNEGGWNTSRPRWALMRDWLGYDLEPPSEAEGLAELVTAWLRAFGPGTDADIKWWLGSTLTAVRKALAAVGAVEVDLDGRAGYVLPDDLAPVEAVEPWGALLPMLDPAVMGWFEREWYLGTYKELLFDTSGNAGPTAWLDGRIVGGWHQDGDAKVVLDLLEDVGAEARGVLETEAARLTEWLGGVRVLPRFPSPLQRQMAGK
jgi:hypothetical protein